MKKAFFFFALVVTFTFASCKKEPIAPDPIIPPTPMEFNFIETGQNIVPDTNDCWHWTWFEVVDDSAHQRVSFLDKGRFKVPYNGSAYPRNAWGDMWKKAGVLLPKISDCDGNACGMVIEVLNASNDQVVKSGSYLTMNNGWMSLKSWQGGTNSRGLLTGTIGGREAIVATVFLFNDGQYDTNQLSFLVGYKK